MPPETTPWIFVQKQVAWHKTPHGYDVGRGSVLAWDAEHRFLELAAQLYRERKGNTLSIELKSGYLVRAGRWVSKGNDTIQVTSSVVDSYKLIQTGALEAPSGLSQEWAVSGAPLGPLKRILRRGKQDFEPTDRFRSTHEVLDFWSHFVLRRPSTPE
jgi:hypothetical protein